MIDTRPGEVRIRWLPHWNRITSWEPTDRGTLVSPAELVIDPDLPDLGLDSRPHHGRATWFPQPCERLGEV